jgi:hypothetical protein
LTEDRVRAYGLAGGLVDVIVSLPPCPYCVPL